MSFITSINEFASQTADIFGLLSMIISAVGWFFVYSQLKQQKKLDNHFINIYLKVLGGRRYAISRIRRKNLTRAEVQGVLGALPRKKGISYYRIAYLTDPRFFKAIEDNQIGVDQFPFYSKNRTVETKIDIEITEDEIACFDLEALDKISRAN